MAGAVPGLARSSVTGRRRQPKGPSWAPMMACSTPPTAMSRRQDELLSSGGRLSMRQTGDTLKSEHLFFDQMDFLGQLGLLPD